MFTYEVEQSLLEQHINFPRVYVIDTMFSPLKYIPYPHGLLQFSNNKIDHLFLQDPDAYPYAVAILAFYFCPDMITLNEPFYTKHYEAFKVDDKVYTDLTKEALSELRCAGEVLLYRDIKSDSNPDLVFLGFSSKTLLEDMLSCQATDPFKTTGDTIKGN